MVLRSITFWRFPRVLKTFVFILFGRELLYVHGRVQNTAARDFTEHHRTTQNPSIRTFVEYLSFYRLYSRIIACLLNDKNYTRSLDLPGFKLFLKKSTFIVTSSVTLQTFGDSLRPLENSFRFFQIILHCKYPESERICKNLQGTKMIHQRFAK